MTFVCVKNTNNLNNQLMLIVNKQTETLHASFAGKKSKDEKQE